MKKLFTYIFTLLSLPIFSQTGLIINEVSQGPSGTKEYIELVVVAPSGTCFVDIRNWIVDDNNGDFSGGPASGSGIAGGHVRFTNDAQWQNVPTGSIIVIYNGGDKNSSIPADDPSDSNNDKVYILPVSSSLLMEGCNTAPVVGNSAYVPCAYGAATWTPLGLANSGDAVQVRTPSAVFFHGFSYGNGACGCITAGPTFKVDACGTSCAAKVYSFTNNISNDYNNVTNYTVGSSPAGETPGAPNNANNNVWRNNLLCVLPLSAITLKSVVKGNQVLLEYQIHQNEYVKNLVLQHATIKTPFEDLAEMNYSNTYTHLLNDNETHYYRILFQDKDGNIRISNTVSVQIQIHTTDNQIMNLYPNPVNNQFNLTFAQSQTGYVQIFNLAGQLVYQKEIQNTTSEVISTENWNTGMYVARFISNQGETLMQKFLKTEN